MWVLCSELSKIYRETGNGAHQGACTSPVQRRRGTNGANNRTDFPRLKSGDLDSLGILA